MQFLDIHTHKESRGDAFESILSVSLSGMPQAAWPEDRWISAGLHPWFARLENLDTDLNRLAALAVKPEVRLIGECGLDRLRGEVLESQLVILKKQLYLANELDKPVILHCVRCFDELTALTSELKLHVPLIIHGFNKHEKLGRQLMDKGFHLSFGKAILNVGSGAATLIQDTDDFFLETDYANCDITDIYQAAANLKKCTVEELKALIFANWKKIKLI